VKKKDIYEPSLELAEEVKKGYANLQPKDELFDMKRADEMMDGAIDIHCLSGPDSSATRPWNEIDLGIEACTWGMAAVVFKANGYCSTARSAFLAQQVVNKWAADNNRKSTQLIGGVILNNAVGGLNPHAVEASAKIGGKFVWTPSADAWWHRKLTGQGGGIKVLDEDEKVLPALKDIFSIATRYDLVVGMCHQNTKERLLMIDACRDAGVKRILLIHPQQPSNKMTIDQMKVAAKKGAYMGIYCCDFHPPFFDWNETLDIIKEVGPASVILGTDLGNFKWPHPVDSFRRYIALLLDKGVNEKDVEQMAKINPRNLIN